MSRLPLSDLTSARPLPESPYRIGWGTLSIAATLVGFYVLEMIVAAQHGALWELVWHGEVGTKWLHAFRIHPLWTEYPLLLFPHMFSHGALLGHFLFNTGMLLICAPSIEGRMGGRWTWGVFLAVGVVSGALQSSLLNTASWGASGPGMAFLAAWLVLDARPTARKVWGWMDRFPRIRDSHVFSTWVEWGQADATWTWGPWGLVGLMAAFSIMGLGSGDGIGHLSHLTGLAVGALLALVLQEQPTGGPDSGSSAGAARP